MVIKKQVCHGLYETPSMEITDVQSESYLCQSAVSPFDNVVLDPLEEREFEW